MALWLPVLSFLILAVLIQTPTKCEVIALPLPDHVGVVVAHAPFYYHIPLKSIALHLNKNKMISLHKRRFCVEFGPEVLWKVWKCRQCSWMNRFKHILLYKNTNCLWILEFTFPLFPILYPYEYLSKQIMINSSKITCVCSFVCSGFLSHSRIFH